VGKPRESQKEELTMMRKVVVNKEIRCRACLCVLLVVTLCVIPQLAGSAARRGPAARQLLSLLKRADREYVGEFTLKCRAAYPYNPMRGFPCRVLRQLTATGSDYSVVTESTFLKQLFPLGDPRGGLKVDTMSRDGRQYVALKTEIMTLHERDFVGVLETDDLVVVEDDGSLSRDPKSPGFRMAHLDIPSPTKPRRTTEDLLALLTGGRGFSEWIQIITSVRQGQDGLLHCTADGRAYNQPCKWELVVEPRAGYLVRRARAWAPNGFEYFNIENRGTKRFGRVKVPAEGTFWAASAPDRRDEVRHKYEVTFTSYKAAADANLIRRARKLLHEELPIGTEVHDFRNGDEHPQPYTISEPKRKPARAK
jgi:hypothetical protein